MLTEVEKWIEFLEVSLGRSYGWKAGQRQDSMIGLASFEF